MSNSGNTLNKKTIIAIVIIAILLIAAIIGVVVFLKDQGETSAMAENGSQTSSDENVQAEQDAQNQEPQEQAQTEEQNADTQNNEQEGESTEVATTNDGANQGEATTGTTSGNSGTGAGTSNSGNNANNNDNDAENIQESVIEETQTVETEETVKTEEGEILSWTPQALAASGVAANIKLNAPNLVTEKTSVVVDKEDNEIGGTTVALDQKVKYTITIENKGNVAGVVKSNRTFDTLPEGFDYSSNKAEDYAFKAEILDATGNVVENKKLEFSDIEIKDRKATLKKDITLEAGERLVVEYSLKVDADYLKGEGSADIARNVVTVNNLPVEDENEYEGVQPLVKVNKTSKVYRNNVEVADKIAKVGDVIEYTIHIENNGGADTVINVEDDDLANILADGKAEFRAIEENTAGITTKEDLINGKDITMYQGTSLDITFTIEVKKIAGIIKNGLEVKDTSDENPDPENENDPEHPDEIETVDITGVKTAETNGTVYEKDKFTYKITLTNTGSKEAETVVKDIIPDGVTVTGDVKVSNDTEKYDVDELESGLTVKVPGNNGKVEITFEVEANVIKGDSSSATVVNEAYYNVGEDGPNDEGDKTPEVPTTINKAYVTVNVTKVWDEDNATQALRRPDSINFVLVADDEATDIKLENQTVNKDFSIKEQEYSFGTVPKYDENGNPIEYDVIEEEVNDGDLLFYESTPETPVVDANGNTSVTITNTFTLKNIPDNNKTPIEVTKVWDDNDNYADKRTDVTLTVTGNNKSENVELSESNALKEDANTWKDTVDMDKYTTDGVEITYAVSEKNVPDFYEVSYNQDALTVTNKFVGSDETIDVKVNKVWKDNETQAKRRPSSIEFVLTKMENRNKVEVDRATMTDTSKDESVEFPNLPKYDDKANIIDYNVEEVNAGEFYTSTMSPESIDDKGNIEVTVTNKFTLPENNTTSIQVTKVWDDKGHEDKRPTGGVSFDVVGMDVNEIVEEKNIELSAEDADPENSYVWKKEVTLQKYDQNGEEIVYSVTEPTVPQFYEKSENGTTVTNRFVGDSSTTKDITITKKWEDSNDKAEKRPQSVKFIISSDVLDFNYEETLSVTTDEDNSTPNEWTKTITVRKYDDNANEINYKVDEVETGDLYFYKKSINNEKLTITNTFTVPDEKVTVTVNKVWDEDNDTQKGHRPYSVEFELKDGNSVVDTETMKNTAENSSITFDPQAKYDELGNEINYTVEETEVNEGDLFFYTTVVSDLTPNPDDENQLTATVRNEFQVPTGGENEQDLTLTKVWDDNGNNAKKRPTSIVLTLNGTDNTTRDYTLTAPDSENNTAGEWKYTAENLPIYDSNGTKIEYNLTEIDENIPDNYALAEDNDGNLTVTNTFTHNDEQVSLTLVKEWDDNENANRPEKVTFKITGTSTTGTTTRTEEVTEDTWTKEIKVDKYNARNDEITYTVTEVDVAEGYVSSTPSKEDNNTWKVTNSLPSISVSKEITKVTHSDGTSDTIEPNEDVVVTKGDVIEYTITVANNSNIPLNNVVVTDISLPVTYNPDGKTDVIPEDKDGRKVIELESALIKGTSNEVKVYYLVTENDFLNNTNIANTVKATGEYTINDKTETVESEDSENASVEQVPGISITKTQKVTDNAPATQKGYVGEGDVITYTITVKNTGNTVLEDINIEDEMSGQYGELDIDEADLTIDTLEPTKTKVITATYTVTKGDISETENHNIVNSVTVTAKDSESDKEVEDEDETTPVVTEKGAPDISISKKSKVIKADKNKKTNSDGTPYTGNYNVAELGDTIRYTITVKNNGNVTGTATVSDEAPKGTTFDEIITQGIEKVGDGFSTEVELGPKDTASDTKTIVFEVTVTAKAGTTIENTATLDGEESGNTTKDTVEKTVKVKTNTATPTITNSNVVIVLDASISMSQNSATIRGGVCTKHRNDWGHSVGGCVKVDGVWYTTTRDTRMNIAKDVVQDFIKSMNFESDGSGSSVSVVTFWGASSYYYPASGTDYSEALNVSSSGNNTIADTPEEALYLADTSVENVKTKSGTCISGALLRAKEQMQLLDQAKPQNNNIVIFIGDGDPSADDEENKISDYADDLDKIADIYAVGFGINSSILKNDIASSTDKYYTTEDNLDLSAIFTQIGEDLSDPVESNEVSNNGLVELDNIDTSKDITITVDGENVYEGKVSDTDYIETTDGKYYLDTTQFDAGAEIEITYTENS